MCLRSPNSCAPRRRMNPCRRNRQGSRMRFFSPQSGSPDAPKTRRLPRRVFMMAAAVLFLFHATLSGGPRWVKLQSAHFELITRSDAKAGSDLLVQMEGARDYFQRSAGVKLPAAPVRVLGFGSDEEFALYRSSPFAAAFYASTPAGDYIALKDTSSDYVPMALHEYAHHVM